MLYASFIRIFCLLRNATDLKDSYQSTPYILFQNDAEPKGFLVLLEFRFEVK